MIVNKSVHIITYYLLSKTCFDIVINQSKVQIELWHLCQTMNYFDSLSDICQGTFYNVTINMYMLLFTCQNIFDIVKNFSKIRNKLWYLSNYELFWHFYYTCQGTFNNFRKVNLFVIPNKYVHIVIYLWIHCVKNFSRVGNTSVKTCKLAELTPTLKTNLTFFKSQSKRLFSI